MTDFTAEVAHLDAAYRANRVANTTIAAEVKGKYRAIIAEEIRIRRQEADLEFARTLARVKEESGMPLHIIQDRVLHTKSWNRWTYWRDLANIEPERVTIANAREERLLAERVFRWEVCEDNEIGYAIVLMKDAEGKKLDEEVWFTFITEKEGVLSVWPDRENPVHVDLWNERWNKEPLKLKRFLSDLANENRKDIS